MMKRRKRDAVDKLYDSIEKKDMTRAEFRRRYIAAMDPRRAAVDLQQIQQVLRGRKFAEQENRQLIGEAL